MKKLINIFLLVLFIVVISVWVKEQRNVSIEECDQNAMFSIQEL
jgi:hypothetical protein